MEVIGQLEISQHHQVDQLNQAVVLGALPELKL